MVRELWEFKDLRDALEGAGHDYHDFLQEHVTDIKASAAAWKVVMDTLKEKKKAAAAEEKRARQRKKQVGRYMTAQAGIQNDVNSLLDEDNQGQNQAFEKRAYRFDAGDHNRLKFQPRYKERTHRAFGRL